MTPIAACHEEEGMTPIPVGTIVDYHGSCTHGRYVITAHQQPPYGIPEVNYPDGVAYVIWDIKVPPRLRKMGNGQYSVHRVRRQSLTVVP